MQNLGEMGPSNSVTEDDDFEVQKKYFNTEEDVQSESIINPVDSKALYGTTD